VRFMLGVDRRWSRRKFAWDVTTMVPTQSTHTHTRHSLHVHVIKIMLFPSPENTTLYIAQGHSLLPPRYSHECDTSHAYARIRTRAYGQLDMVRGAHCDPAGGMGSYRRTILRQRNCMHRLTRCLAYGFRDAQLAPHHRPNGGVIAGSPSRRPPRPPRL
jgi:hypothetical protein